ncbi:hypothetical protein [Leptolyngbya sp. FACHB-16]|uniref:hypothetical protein n=1 Tax=unclassified Leptolyngbya TaxID=2650499 RepID=UPI0016861189|nr:hypothetical protein [Leptolyngbya sp. FACHB-16]MBD2156168.1 hypothetical protein [Leptolyngbya sp. FACHB-16]
MGKTMLSVRLAQPLEEEFEEIIWRSLRNALPLSTLLADVLLTLSGNQRVHPISVSEADAAHLTHKSSND